MISTVLVTSVSLVSGALALAWFVSSVLLRRWPARQDLVLRAALVAVALLPFGLWLRSVSPGLTLAVLPAEESASQVTVGGDALVPERLPASAPEVVTTAPVPSNTEAASPPPARTSAAAPIDVSAVAPSAAPTPSLEELATEPLSAADDAAEQSGPARASAVLSSSDILVVVWFCGVAVSLGLLVVAALRIRRILRQSTNLETQIWQDRLQSASTAAEFRGSLRAVSSEEVTSPFVTGVLHPTIVIPQSHLVLDEMTLMQILVHETAHIRRGDHVTNMLMQLVGAVWWPHPMVYWLRMRLAWLREILADARVAAVVDPVDYAETLFAMASGASPTLQGQLAIEPRPGTLETRVASVLDEEIRLRARVPGGWLRRGVWTSVAAASLAVAVLHFVPVEAIALTGFRRDVPQDPVVTGSVTRPNGSPAVNADVYLLRRPKGSYSLPTHPRKARTDQAGKFVFDKVEPGRYSVWSETRRLTSLPKKLHGQPITVEKARPTDPLSIKLHDGCHYDVKVHSASTKQPIAGAVVTFGWTDIERKFRSKKDGIAHVTGLARDDWYFVVRAPGYAADSRRVPPQKPGTTTTLEFALKPGGSISGFVRDEAGKAIAGAKLYVGATNGGMRPAHVRRETDKSGAFVAAGLPIGEPVRVSVSADEFVSVDRQISLRPDMPDIKQDFSLKRRQYAGTGVFLVQDENGKPLAGVKLTNQGNNSGHVRETTSDARGRATLKQLYSGIRGVTVVTKSDGYVAQRFAVDVKATRAAPQILRLTRGQTLRGRLLTDKGKPAKNVRVYFNQGDHGELEGGRVRTNANGEFTINGLPPESTITVYVPRGFSPISDRPVKPGGDEILEIRMQQESVVIVRGLDAETGVRLPEYNVRIGFGKRQQGDPSMTLPGRLVHNGENIVGAKKEFRMGGLLEGFPLEITVSADGYKTRTIDRVSAVRADRARPLLVRLERDKDARRTVAGRLIIDGKPVVGAAVYLVVGDMIPDNQQWRFYHWHSLIEGNIKRDAHCLQFLTATTKRSGRFEFKGVREAAWYEIYHTGGGAANGRHRFAGDVPKQKDRPHMLAPIGDTGNMESLLLKAVRPGSMRISVDRTKYPDAHSLWISAESWSRGPAAYSYSRKKITDGAPLTVSGLPAGRYQVSILGKPRLMKNGSVQTRTLKAENIAVSSGETEEFTFD